MNFALVLVVAAGVLQLPGSMASQGGCMVCQDGNVMSSQPELAYCGNATVIPFGAIISGTCNDQTWTSTCGSNGKMSDPNLPTVGLTFPYPTTVSYLVCLSLLTDIVGFGGVGFTDGCDSSCGSKADKVNLALDLNPDPSDGPSGAYCVEVGCGSNITETDQVNENGNFLLGCNCSAPEFGGFSTALECCTNCFAAAACAGVKLSLCGCSGISVPCPSCPATTAKGPSIIGMYTKLYGGVGLSDECDASCTEKAVIINSELGLTPNSSIGIPTPAAYCRSCSYTSGSTSGYQIPGNLVLGCQCTATDFRGFSTQLQCCTDCLTVAACAGASFDVCGCAGGSVACPACSTSNSSNNMLLLLLLLLLLIPLAVLFCLCYRLVHLRNQKRIDNEFCHFDPQAFDASLCNSVVPQLQLPFSSKGDHDDPFIIDSVSKDGKRDMLTFDPQSFDSTLLSPFATKQSTGSQNGKKAKLRDMELFDPQALGSSILSPCNPLQVPQQSDSTLAKVGKKGKRSQNIQYTSFDPLAMDSSIIHQTPQ